MQDREMNERDAGFWVDVLNGLKNAWPQILGSMMAGIICYGRLIYDTVIADFHR